MTTVQFAPWSSNIDLSFYAALTSRKINHDKLDDAARKLVGRYEVRPSDPPERSARMQFHGNAFTADDLPAGLLRADGIFKNVNTIEDYRKLDKNAVIDRAGRTIWEAVIDGSIYSCPSLLASFYAIFFADLKKYKFNYHFAYPALHSDPPWKLVNRSARESKSLPPLESKFLFEAVQTWRYGADQRQHGFFLAKRDRLPGSNNGFSDESLVTGDNAADGSSQDRPKTPKTPTSSDLGFQWIIGPLMNFEQGFFSNVKPEDQYVCFSDPSTYPENPGWMLRNLLVLIQRKWKLQDIQILCYRDTHMRRDYSASLVLNLHCDSLQHQDDQNPMPKVTGWERNEHNRVQGRTVNLADYMDPKRLADQSVDLNLKLMKWRIAPELDLDVIKGTRCLLLGSGTLGSYVSRNLLGWGVRKVTFVDNAKVSFSNPVRQPLFGFKDCLDGGVDKAARAAEALQEIYPGVDAKGHRLSVPMAGHPTTDESKTKTDFEELERLIDDHDAIFLLMDSRESRWLPTVMAKAKDKIVMNAALGFDTYVVMRHGAMARTEGEKSDNLGCYFCNDVVAPADSLKDLTLDQQCTVTRPGIAAIASALLVEILVSILQHPLRSRAPAPASRAAERSPMSHPLGLIPHQIRGFLTNFDNLMIRGSSYDCCSACSPKVLDAYRNSGWDFVKRALNEHGFVEELSGLAEVQRKAEEAERAMEVVEDEDDESIGEIGDEGELI